jgi:hypothetical protein
MNATGNTVSAGGRTRFAAICAATTALISLILGVSLTPASAVPDSDLVTLKGHVRTVDGDPIAGIRVHAGIAIDEQANPDADPNLANTTRTNKNGRYELRVTAGTSLGMSFTDPDDNYFSKSKDRFTGKAGHSYRVNRTLVEVSEIAGTVRDESGAPIARASVKAYDAKSGKSTHRSTLSNAAGRYHLLVPGGSYKLRFARLDENNSLPTVNAEWHGDASTRATSPTVKVKPGGKTAKTNAVLR